MQIHDMRKSLLEPKIVRGEITSVEEMPYYGQSKKDICLAVYLTTGYMLLLSSKEIALLASALSRVTEEAS